MTISSRQEKILISLIKEYIKTAQALSSSFLVDQCNLKISSATARNEMAELEKQEYLFQPHTSAGRIPTAKAYRYYVDNYLFNKAEKKKSFKDLESLVLKEEDSFKRAAKIIADLSNNAVFWAFHKNNLYYTGISNLFTQPEFRSSDLAGDISLIIDRMEEIIAESFDCFQMGEEVFIGKENPFGHFLSSVLLKYNYKKNIGVVGLLGPLRMDYEKNLDIIRFLKNKL